MGLAKKILNLHNRMNTRFVRVDDPNFADWPDVAPSRNLNRSQIIASIQAKNPKRWARLAGDFQWAQAEMVKLGRNPEDVRFLL